MSSGREPGESWRADSQRREPAGTCDGEHWREHSHWMLPSLSHEPRTCPDRPARPAEQARRLVRVSPDTAIANRMQALLDRTGFKSRMAFGGLESPAVCQSGADVMMRLLAVGGARLADTTATLGSLKEPKRSQGLRGTDPGSRKGSHQIFEPGSAPARFESPDHTRDS